MSSSGKKSALYYLFFPVAMISVLPCALLCLPPLIWHNSHSKRKRNEISGKVRRRSRPFRARPPPERKRKVAASLEAPGPHTRLQSQSPLFTRLPAEVRQIIFEYALGGATYHLTIRGQNMHAGSWTCRSPAACLALRAMVCTVPRPGKAWEKPADRKLLGAPLSCRRAYFETLCLLYSRNSFIAAHDDFLELLPRMIQPSCLALIRHFSFSMEFRFPPRPDADAPHDYKTVLWLSTWRNVADMTGLESLCVLISVQRGNAAGSWMQHEEAVLAPIRAVNAPASFDLYLPYTEEPCRVEGLPCRVHRAPPEPVRAENINFLSLV